MKIGILLGDDIGLEVVPVAVDVMKAALAKTGLEVDWTPLPIGAKAHETHGNTLPEVTVKGLETVDGFIMGPIGHTAYPKNEPGWGGMPPVRKMYDLYANVKPVLSYGNIPSVHKDVDIVFIRETTEGLLTHNLPVAGTSEYKPNDDIAIGTRVVTRAGAKRVAREAFEIARMRPRKKVTAVHKAAVYRLVCGLFAEECRNVAADYPDVSFEEIHIDTIAAQLVMNPQQFDVVVTTNIFGDILTDLGAGLVGGLGLAPGLCIGTEKAMAQATHGSAPDIAGQNIANPYAMIQSGRQLVEWLGRKHDEPRATEAAKLIEDAVAHVIDEGRVLTRDIGGSASTTEMGDAVIDAVGD
jgi:3-isopropylmalate dehydrogenase